MRYFNAAGADETGEIGELHDPEPHLIPLALAATRADGPVLRGDRVRWGDLGTIPFDALGAPRVLSVSEGGSQ